MPSRIHTPESNRSPQQLDRDRLTENHCAGGVPGHAAAANRFKAKEPQPNGTAGVAAPGLDFQETLAFLFRTLRDEHTTRAAADRILQQIEEETAAKQLRHQLYQQYPVNSECPNCGFIKPEPGADAEAEAEAA